MEFKSFLLDLKEWFQQGFVRTKEDVTFKLRVGYRLESSSESQ